MCQRLVGRADWKALFSVRRDSLSHTAPAKGMIRSARKEAGTDIKAKSRPLTRQVIEEKKSPKRHCCRIKFSQRGGFDAASRGGMLRSEIGSHNSGLNRLCTPMH
jgi:hypothetical protein